MKYGCDRIEPMTKPCSRTGLPPTFFASVCIRIQFKEIEKKSLDKSTDIYIFNSHTYRLHDLLIIMQHESRVALGERA